MKTKKTTKDDLFEDLGFGKEESVALKRRADCVVEIVRIVSENEYAQKDLSKILDLPQSRVSDLLNAKVSKFSLEALLDFLELLGAEPEIKTMVKHPKKIVARVSLIQSRGR